ncbi:MAG TPA: hypothetical protein VGV61_10140, partial [Thermoanaerobaculia bacterium]|nr:hypothetical protein [Thermoanaerobaculia bacterium]
WSWPTRSDGAWDRRNVTDIGFGAATPTGRRVFLGMSGLTGARVVMSESSGASFRSITGDLPAQVNVRALLVDPANDHVLYVGSDTGVWVSVDRGAHWAPYSSGLPAVPYVNDLEYDAVNAKVVAGTYGRGVFMVAPLPGPLFYDGFETGDTRAWGGTAP